MGCVEARVWLVALGACLLHLGVSGSCQGLLASRAWAVSWVLSNSHSPVRSHPHQRFHNLSNSATKWRTHVQKQVPVGTFLVQIIILVITENSAKNLLPPWENISLSFPAPTKRMQTTEPADRRTNALKLSFSPLILISGFKEEAHISSVTQQGRQHDFIRRGKKNCQQ